VLEAAPLREIHIVGRRGPGDAGFSPQELSELGMLTRAQPVVDVAALPEPGAATNPAIITILREFAGRGPTSTKPLAIRFHFGAVPAGFAGAGRVEAAIFGGPAGSLTLPADLVVTCIGYRPVPCCTLTPGTAHFANVDGRIEPGLYVVGWAKRGPSGTIATNRAEAHEVARRLAAEVQPSGRPGSDGLARLLAVRGARPVSFGDWLRIDAAERAAAPPGRPRRKLVDRAALLAALD
jgi:ferredoxin--NADP+ reductase